MGFGSSQTRSEEADCLEMNEDEGGGGDAEGDETWPTRGYFSPPASGQSDPLDEDKNQLKEHRQLSAGQSRHCGCCNYSYWLQDMCKQGHGWDLMIFFHCRTFLNIITRLYKPGVRTWWGNVRWWRQTSLPTDRPCWTSQRKQDLQIFTSVMAPWCEVPSGAFISKIFFRRIKVEKIIKSKRYKSEWSFQRIMWLCDWTVTSTSNPSLRTV